MAAAPRCPDFARLLREASPDAALSAQLVTCFGRELERQARQRCRSTTLAEDAVQDALVGALENIGSFRGDAPIEAWLRRLVVSSCSRLTRGRKNAPAFNRPLDELSGEAEAGDGAGLQEQAVLLSERLALLRDAMADLSDQNRALLLAHEAEDEPIAELARRFDTTEESIKSRLKRSRAQLRRRLLELADAEVG
ncbi:MAG: sigma-70 family RNA polymerase sigma factor [Deltaproteobacteria bacterium]|nr:sigma-70 family RNA polymerase sigma factor [Deltaproteobacteria bacterium]